MRRKLPIPARLAPLVQASIDIGRELYLQDKACSIATDVLRDRLGGLAGHDLGGYMSFRGMDEKGADLQSIQVIFYTASQPTMVKYAVLVPFVRGLKNDFQELTPPVRPDESAMVFIRAREAAIRAAGPFQQPINPVVMTAGPLGKDGQILVELLAGTKAPGVVVLGKHYRVLVAADGVRVDSVKALSRGTLELKTKDERGSRLAALYATQLESDYPLETHVFASLAARIPLYVMTPDRSLWLVDGDEISLLEPR